MTVLDWAIVAFIAGFALLGFRRGPIVGLLTFGAFAALGLVLVWLLAAAIVRSPDSGELRREVRRSLIVGELNRLLPPPDPILEAFDRVDPLPKLDEPATPVAPPDSAIAADPDVRAASRSVVRVLGNACGLGIEGSGWVAAPGLVATNAHVVAGEDETEVNTIDDASLDAIPVLYDPADDLALLRIDDVLPALPLAADPARGRAGAVLGYPENGPYAATAARMGDVRSVLSDDSYGRGPLRRAIATFRGRVRSGNSGGPLIDARGQVMATVFAATTSGPPGGFGIPNDVLERALRGPLATEVDTGPCNG